VAAGGGVCCASHHSLLQTLMQYAAGKQIKAEEDEFHLAFI